MRRGWLALCGALLLGTPLLAARANDPAAAGAATASADAPAPVTQENWDDKRPMWVERLRAASERVERAVVRHRKAIDAYSHMRSRQRARGSEKQAILDELDAADAELQEAETALGELRASARRAGVPPGWFRDAGAAGSPPARPAEPAP